MEELRGPNQVSNHKLKPREAITGRFIRRCCYDLVEKITTTAFSPRVSSTVFSISRQRFTALELPVFHLPFLQVGRILLDDSLLFPPPRPVDAPRPSISFTERRSLDAGQLSPSKVYKTSIFLANRFLCDKFHNAVPWHLHSLSVPQSSESIPPAAEPNLENPTRRPGTACRLEAQRPEHRRGPWQDFIEHA